MSSKPRLYSRIRSDGIYPDAARAFLVCFEGCGPCHEYLYETAETNMIMTEADAHLAFDATGKPQSDKCRAIRAGQEGLS